MKIFYYWFFIFVLSLNLSCGWGVVRYPDRPGAIFIRQQICDIDYFKKEFLMNSQTDLKDQGFAAYSLHRDVMDPKTYLIVLRCKDLKKGIEYVQASHFHSICVGSGLGALLIWAGEDVRVHVYRNLLPMLGGIVITRAPVDDWKTAYDQLAQNPLGLPQSQEVDDFFHLQGKPDVVLEVKETSNGTLPPQSKTEFLKGVPNGGEENQEVWCGINLEEGLF